VKVYIRDFATRSIIKEIDVSSVEGTSNYERFERGLYHNMDLDKYYLDDDEYQKSQRLKAGEDSKEGR